MFEAPASEYLVPFDGSFRVSKASTSALTDRNPHKGKHRKRATDALKQLQRESLLSNPLLEFDQVLVVRRRSQGDRGLPANWQGNERLKRTGYINDIALLTLDDRKNRLRAIYRPPGVCQP